MSVVSLIDTNVLVYAVDPRASAKLAVARDLLRTAHVDHALVIPHQAIVEFVSAVTRPRRDLEGAAILARADAWAFAEELIRTRPILFPDASVLSTALRGAGVYQLSWFDAHLWAYAEANGIPEILSEDFTHGRHYGSVRVRNPFLSVVDGVHELPPLYDPD